MWRTFDVGAVVGSLVSEAAVVAGANGMTRSVSRAKLATTPENLRRVGANDLVVTTADVLLAIDESWHKLISYLLESQVAAVAVRLNASEPLPTSLIDSADELALPIITFPPTETLADVTTAVLDALLDAQGQRLERVLEIHQRFTPIILDGGGVADVATALHSLLECPVAILDPERRPTVVVPTDARSQIESATDACVRQPIVAGDHDYGEIVALVDDADLDEDGRLALQRASLAIAVRLAHARAVAADQERFAATSLEELIAGNAGNIADVSERAISFGWDLTRPRAVLLASIDPPTNHETLPNSLATIAAAARATLGPDAIVWSRSTTIAALVAPGTDDPAERRRIAERLRHELDRRVTSVMVSIGVGRTVDDPLALHRSYFEASRAVDVGRWAKGRHVTEVFDELGLERLLASTPSDDLAEFVEHAIGRLVDYDRAHNTELVDTLAMWLDTHNMAEAARRLFVHYNTFKNRLDRIESILGPVLSDGARSLECAVAIYVFRQYDGPWTTRPQDLSTYSLGP